MTDLVSAHVGSPPLTWRPGELEKDITKPKVSVIDHGATLEP